MSERVEADAVKAPRFYPEIRLDNLLTLLGIIGSAVTILWAGGGMMQHILDRLDQLSSAVRIEQAARTDAVAGLARNIRALAEQEHTDIATVNRRIDVLTSAVLQRQTQTP